MTAFEVVFILLTIITSLALTHLLTGFVSMLRNAGRVRFSVLHALWAWIAFTLLIGNWASYWSMRSVTSWPAWAVLLIVTNFIIQYVFCSLVTPETPAVGNIDLVEFHEREHRRYILALVVLLVASLVLNFALGGAHFYAGWWRDSVLSIAAIILALFAFFAGPRWVQIGSAGALAALGTYYMIITCNVVAA
ncbi:MAG: hypothetical protein ABR555_11550 [Pyrinomonadaceae bacterium]